MNPKRHHLNRYANTGVPILSRSIIVGEAHESNSVANLLIRGYAYSGDPHYLAAHQQQASEFNQQLEVLQQLDGDDYSLDAATEFALLRLTGKYRRMCIGLV